MNLRYWLGLESFDKSVTALHLSLRRSRRASDLCEMYSFNKVACASRVRRLLLPGDDLLRLENLLKEEWNGISQATVNRLIGSMPTRVHDVIELSGESTRFFSTTENA